MRISLFIAAAVLLSCCENSTKSRVEPLDGSLDKEELLEGNKQAMRVEMRDISNYVSRHSLNTIETSSGLHISLVRDVESERARPDDIVVVNYDLSLLSGRECYSSKDKGAEHFRVEHDQVESGLHEGIQLMSPGDSAILIIPSYLAHGLIGDQNEIPMRSTIVYHIGLERLSHAH